MDQYILKISGHDEAEFAKEICEEMAVSAQKRGTGIARRSVDYIYKKLESGQAFVAIDRHALQIAGFCYIEIWNDGAYIANSGLLIFPNHRGKGLASRLKAFAFQKSTETFPDAKLFGLTTSAAVMEINSDLGYRPVPYDRLTNDKAFWNDCRSCVNFNVLQNKQCRNCLCTAMLYDPNKKHKSIKKEETS
ncbi:MAG: GNAT family N-acetyltransferase [Pseudobacteriovorax sp.]|nr:GNAT family N-acetyltransferase [Pseudobacteriovorax sp.]